MKRFLASAWDVIEVVVVAFVVVFVVRSYIVQPFLVSGASMEPNFSNRDYLLIDELTYRFREPTRGEVIVFQYPKNESVFFIKRIIGLPEEHVVIKNGAVFIGMGETTRRLEEPYISDLQITSGFLNITLGPDQYLVLGDNRGNSLDSRSWGPVKRSEIVGLARMRILPIGDFNFFTVPQY